MRHSLALGRLLLRPYALEFLRRRFLCDRLLDRHEFSRRCAALGPGARAAQFRLYLAALFHRTLARVVAHRLVHRHVRSSCVGHTTEGSRDLAKCSYAGTEWMARD